MITQASTLTDVRNLKFISINNLGYRLLCLTLALAYGGILASLPLEVFKDRANYLIYAENSWEILIRYWELSPLVGLSNEPLWLLINAGLASVLSPEAALQIIIFSSAVVVAYQILCREPRNFVWLIILLLMPQVIKNHIIQLRQGVAIAVFLTGWFTNRTLLRWLLIGTAPLIHASFFFVLVLLCLAKFSRRLRLAADLRSILFAGTGLGVGVGLVRFASFLGARQAEQYAFTKTEVSGLGFVFWSMVFVLMCFQGRSFMRKYIFEFGSILFYLSTYFVIEVTARIFESAILLVFLVGLQLTGWRRFAFLLAIIIFECTQWSIRSDQSWLGFGMQ